MKETKINAPLVADYHRQFEDALGNEEVFGRLYQEALKDKRIGQPEAIELASRFLAPIAKSTSRPKAMRRLLYRHEKLIESRRASASIGARR